jgi:precorrin-4 methylase
MAEALDSSQAKVLSFVMLHEQSRECIQKQEDSLFTLELTLHAISRSAEAREAEMQDVVRLSMSGKSKMGEMWQQVKELESMLLEVQQNCVKSQMEDATNGKAISKLKVMLSQVCILCILR